MFWAVFCHFSAVWSRILAENQHIYISDLEMSGYSNRGKVMKKTVTVVVGMVKMVYHEMVKMGTKMGIWQCRCTDCQKSQSCPLFFFGYF